MAQQAVTSSLKVGALARRTGVSVRALHHYDDIGLVSPSGRTPAGHRLYTRDDVERLQQVQALRHTGMSLDDIRVLLERPDITPRRAMAMHLHRLRERVQAQQQMLERLESLARHLDTAADVTIDDVCRLIEGMTMMEKYFTKEQRDEIAARGAQLGQERIREVEAAWGEVIPAVRDHMARGTPPTDPAVQALGRQWRALVNEFTGGNREIASAVRTMYAQEGAEINRQMPNTPDPAMFAYMSTVFAAMEGGGPG